MELLYWHWMIFGFALMALEIILPSFMMLWFGLSALIIGATLYLIPNLSLTAQVFLWTVLSIAITVAWFKWLRPLSKDKTLAGLGKEALIGQTGIVLQAPNINGRGRLRFSAPILGSDEWDFLLQNNQTINVGDRVRVIDISGNSLIVNP